MNILSGIYAALLHLYPREFRDEFGDEMLTVFAKAVQDAAQASLIAATWFCLRELRELPINLVGEHWTRFLKGGVTMTTISEFDDRPLSWRETLIGLLPFLILGPVTVLLAYPYPPPSWRTEWFTSIQIIVYLSIMLLGLLAGLIKGWQRWAFSYLGPWIVIAGAVLAGGVNLLVFPRGAEWPIVEQILILIASFTFVTAIVLLFARWVPLARLLYRRVRSDWTQLSLALYFFDALIFSVIDHEEDPNLTVLVILPSVIVLLGALAYLRSRSKRQRLVSLLLGVVIASIASAARNGYYLSFGPALLTIPFLPALLEFLPLQGKTMLTE